MKGSKRVCLEAYPASHVVGMLQHIQHTRWRHLWTGMLNFRIELSPNQVFQKKFMLLCDKYVHIRKNNAISEWKNNWITKMMDYKEIKKREKAWINYEKTEFNTQYRAYKNICNSDTRFPNECHSFWRYLQSSLEA